MPQKNFLSSVWAGCLRDATVRLSVVSVTLLSLCLLPALAVAETPATPAEGSLEYYKALAEKGNAEAKVKLADLYRAGKDVAQNLPEAAKLYRSAAEQGLAEAQFKIGEMLFEGKGVAQDAKEAAQWLEKAAAQGFKAAKDKITDLKAKTKDSLQDLNKALDLIR